MKPTCSYYFQEMKVNFYIRDGKLWFPMDEITAALDLVTNALAWEIKMGSKSISVENISYGFSFSAGMRFSMRFRVSARGQRLHERPVSVWV